jgi:hypothetical protein
VASHQWQAASGKPPVAHIIVQITTWMPPDI